ncbi:glycoside hydrolase family 25 protein [Heterostelium album PN500]|uniref:lysozyme n=1 Tax=Heterostelium pallidum (strain ATCC 26659 / Pp 5 / PN500) TaxID=670386 RepID=D3BU18_HETP5|nr:glycoside hydrolase family 25 protein [Heterostelium album PN500]EFA75204.1 glycoside hydrolase family 25 protein [Heterostelium album PN500]|eukprot:XP_020427338.1 glycoside hydrolase family 25 protein [Heterostelium album PN500]
MGTACNIFSNIFFIGTRDTLSESNLIFWYRQIVVFALCFIALFQVSNAAIGVDISSGSDIPAFQCLKNNGYTFAIIRCYMSTGATDPNCPHSIYNARDGGMEYVDAYIFPCFSCGNGAGQVVDTVNYLKSYNADFGMVWFDIEGPGTYWSDNQGENQAFFNSMLEGASQAGVKVGIYTSYSQWEPIMGNWDGGAKYPLWYAHYDGNPSFSDFSPFGGWSSPAIKQYNGDLTVCGLGVDQNYYP